jgi:hypothetical protein
VEEVYSTGFRACNKFNWLQWFHKIGPGEPQRTQGTQTNLVLRPLRSLRLLLLDVYCGAITAR